MDSLIGPFSPASVFASDMNLLEFAQFGLMFTSVELLMGGFIGLFFSVPYERSREGTVSTDGLQPISCNPRLTIDLLQNSPLQFPHCIPFGRESTGCSRTWADRSAEHQPCVRESKPTSGVASCPCGGSEVLGCMHPPAHRSWPEGHLWTAGGGGGAGRSGAKPAVGPVGGNEQLLYRSKAECCRTRANFQASPVDIYLDLAESAALRPGG